ncbi:hypothetical protein ASD02_25295 [Ensifer sp. Root1252]|nr:hypothetical protein ASD02_25295 [Ensifer sp. Root1252]KQW72535.1 hypothetical protein ASD03_31140 [Ensifer sp. Root127]KRC79344.1 hypothetical protein ASE32_25835 [Ensifer sp. Root231]KRC99736.1 hypothetical protein ASE47_26195 [Ensifer sp. Root258]
MAASVFPPFASFSKSRLNFLSALRAGHQDYVLNDEAMKWLKAQGVEHALMARLKTNPPAVFTDQVAFLDHLAARASISSTDSFCVLLRRRRSGAPSAITACSAAR